MNPSIKLKYDLEKNLWFKSGDDIPYTGELIEYHNDESVSSRTKFSGGKIDGEAACWYEGGEKKSEIDFSNGARYGLASWWSSKGSLRTQCIYKNNRILIASSWEEDGGEKEPVTEFRYENSEAKEVLVCGDFTDWESNPIRLDKISDFIWSKKVSLPKGEYQYKLKVDGEWEEDSLNSARIESSIGVWNSFLNVGSVEEMLKNEVDEKLKSRKGIQRKLQPRQVRGIQLDREGQREAEGIINQDKDLTGKFCPKPFDSLESHEHGGFLCCPTWLPTKAGDLLESSVDEVFNSNSAQEVRKSILDGSFKFCHHKLCPHIQNNSLPDKKDILEKEEVLWNGSNVAGERYKGIITNNIVKGLNPTFHNLCYDESCNLQCPSCRLNKIFYSEGPRYEKKMKIQNKIIKDLFLVHHERSCVVNITGSGDPFGSVIFRELLFNVDGSKCPNVLINLQTNGVMFTPLYWQKMVKLQNNINSVIVSLDSGLEETYKQTRKGGNWEKLMENLSFISELRRNELIRELRLDFVVQQLNYKEMPKFVEIAKSFKADGAYFSLISDWGTFSKEEYNHHSIWKKDHPEFDDFLEVLRDPILNDPIADLGNVTEYKEYAQRK
jgi:wyosine [tRNA(Phe)-imidazoG37] synthetase (radical SAM superfamily)